MLYKAQLQANIRLGGWNFIDFFSIYIFLQAFLHFKPHDLVKMTRYTVSRGGKGKGRWAIKGNGMKVDDEVKQNLSALDIHLDIMMMNVFLLVPLQN